MILKNKIRLNLKIIKNNIKSLTPSSCMVLIGLPSRAKNYTILLQISNGCALVSNSTLIDTKTITVLGGPLANQCPIYVLWSGVKGRLAPPWPHNFIIQIPFRRFSRLSVLKEWIAVLALYLPPFPPALNRMSRLPLVSSIAYIKAL